MNRMPTAVATGGQQLPVHMQPVHSSAVISSSVNISNPLASGMTHQLTGPHDRDHLLGASGSGPLPGHYFSALGMNPGSPHPVSSMMSHGHPHQFHHPHSMLSLNRLPHLIGQPELRVFEMNKRFQQRSDDSDSLWWESFTVDFFEDDATLTLAFLTEDGPKSYTIGRTLIPRYFRSIFESGCGELYYNLRLNHEYFHHPSLTLDSESATMTMNMVRSIPATVVVEGRLTLDFAFDDLMRIRSWIFLIRSHREMITRSMLAIQDPILLEQLSKNVTRYGMTNTTLNFFRLCVILEPMQELMSRQKAYSLTPRDCLKTTLFQKWQRMMPQEATRQPSKRRKRKGSSATTEGNNSVGRAPKRKQSPIHLTPHHIAQPGDVMIVGEPTLMGGDFGDEDERLITRLENTQFDTSGNPNISVSHMNSSFSGLNDNPPGIVSPMSIGAIGGSLSLNSNQSQQIGPSQFRGMSVSSGGLTSNQNVHDNIFPNHMNSFQQNQSVSVSPGQSIYSAGGTNRTVHHAMPMMTQPFISIPNKNLVSGPVGTSRNEQYMSSISAASSEATHQPVRSNSASLIDGPNGLSGFPRCASPGQNPRSASRFTPPSLPNGIISATSVSQQSNFFMPTEMMGGCTSTGHISVPSTPLTSPLTSSFSMDAIDNSSVLHSAPPSLVPTATKSNNSPMLYGSIGTSCTGNQMTPESSVLSSMGGLACDASSAVINDGEEQKLVNNNSQSTRPTTDSG